MTATLDQTPLHSWHVAHAGRMVDFAGWSMPVQYSSIVAEHVATRTAVGLFDVSHMGRLRFDGPQAEHFLDQLLTRRVAGMPAGAVRYSLMTADDGGILDDVLVYHVEGTDGPPYWQLVVNASNRFKILEWLDDQRSLAPGVEFSDRTIESAMIAVQGPGAAALLTPIVAADIVAMKYYTALETRVAGVPALVSRTGYTGEDGWELIVPAESAVKIWESLHAGGVTAAGLGARDTLRLEAGMPLYGHEIHEDIDPITAGLGFAVNLEGRMFPGRDMLARFAAIGGSGRRRVGLELAGRRVAREKYAVFAADEPVGEVTSGTFSPTLGRPIAMAYVAPKFSAVGSELTVDVRGQAEPARVVKLPFYRRKP